MNKLKLIDPYNIKNGMSLFWNGPYSQWHKCSFEFDGIRYNGTEQFMMAGKAHIFGDKASKFHIMKEKSPRKQKALGKFVENFVLDKWEPVCKDIVLLGNVLKFSIPEFKQYLLEDPAEIIVEASPEDTIWGIGLGEEDPRAWNKETWQGKNYLGECLMDTRKFLTTQDESIKMRIESITAILTKEI